ncbi:E3 ubiquitin-protein ligase [Lachnellula suecica]|uniref:E3 ubiquitin-protein ligase n=1 Tax=Lachnellula suecica TaxID=602035 RepID=A0A8T9CEZ1_9HELO|nr:E3 ubiquitin-protein ligase [Lachnellula suecica]
MKSWLVVTAVPEPAAPAGARQKAASSLSSTELAQKFAIVDLIPAIINAGSAAMEIQIAAPAPSHASRVLRNADGYASTRETVPCPAGLLVRVCPAMNAALNSSRDVSIDAQGFAVKLAPSIEETKDTEVVVDDTEPKKFRELDLDKTPVVVLGCGHFFTAESLDKHMRLSDVYSVDDAGEFTGLKELTHFGATIPGCPDCKQPVRQHLINRYNRVISRDINDKTAKKFLIDGKSKLRDMELQIAKLEQDLKRARDIVSKRLAGHTNEELHPELKIELEKLLQMCYESSSRAIRAIDFSSKGLSDSCRPMQELSAVVTSRKRTPDGRNLTDATKVAPLDTRIILGCRAAAVKVKYVVLADALSVARIVKAPGTSRDINIPGSAPEGFCGFFFEMSKALINDCLPAGLPKVAVEVIIHFAKMARAFETFCHASEIDLTNSTNILAEAEAHLTTATWICANLAFQNAEVLGTAVEETINSLKKPWFEEATLEETAAVKPVVIKEAAAFEGPWYFCEKGHPFSLGECGTTEQLAKCPECGAKISGLEHLSIETVQAEDSVETVEADVTAEIAEAIEAVALEENTGV